MLTIRNAQMLVFEELAFAKLAVDAIEYLRTEMPELTEQLSDFELQERLRLCMEIAGDYGLSDAGVVLAIVSSTLLLYDVRFDLDPDYEWAGKILTSPYLTDREKATQLLDYAFTEHQLIMED